MPGAGGAQEVGVGGDGGRPARGRGGARAGDREEAERLAQSQQRGVSERPQSSGKEVRTGVGASGKGRNWSPCPGDLAKATPWCLH